MTQWHLSYQSKCQPQGYFQEKKDKFDKRNELIYRAKQKLDSISFHEPYLDHVILVCVLN